MKTLQLTLVIIVIFLSMVSIATPKSNTDLPPPDLTLEQLPPMTPQELSHALGWVRDPNTPTVCRGYYQEPFLNPNRVAIKSLKQSRTQISSDRGLFKSKGRSTLIGNVEMQQPGRRLTSEKAHIYRDPKTGELTSADFYTNVHVREPGRLIIGDHAYLRFDKDQGHINNVLYRIATVDEQKRLAINNNNNRLVRSYALNAWGRSVKAEQLKKDVYQFSQATYSTCPPDALAWKIKAKKIYLNRVIGYGEAYHARLIVKGIPIIYTPYINFPIDNRRKSGFLFPNVGNSTRIGRYVSLPFYLNIAPNYDFTITPVYMSKRGYLFDNEFRFLTKTSRGNLIFSIIPQDSEFQDFRNKTQMTDFPGGSIATQNYNRSSLRRLKNSNLSRYRITFKDNTRFNQYSGGNINLNYVSDDYFSQDFRNIRQIEQSQLPREGNLYFNTKHVRFNIFSRYYQTLHPIDQPLLTSPYAQLPEVDLAILYPHSFFKADYNLNTQFVYFTHPKTPGQPRVVIGKRYHIRPAISRTFEYGAIYMTPRFQLDAVKEYLIRQAPTFDNQPQRLIPMFDINTGIKLEREFNLHKKNYVQTLEPQLYYLFVPYHSQRDFPIFDTSEPLLTVPQLLADNRFSGLDRLGDANQLTLAMTSRFLKKPDNNQKILFQIGQTYYFANRRVTLCRARGCSDSNDLSPTAPISPIISNLSYYFSNAFSVNGNIAWDPRKKSPMSQGVQLHYQPDDKRIINLGYQISQRRVPNTVGGINVDRIDQYLGTKPRVGNASMVWPIPLFNQWSIVASGSYNFTMNHALGTLFGVEYNSCCWGLRMFTSRTFNFQDSRNRRNVYDTTYYFQVVLRGLGAFGSGNPSSLLKTNITGFKDSYENAIPKFG